MTLSRELPSLYDILTNSIGIFSSDILLGVVLTLSDLDENNLVKQSIKHILLYICDIYILEDLKWDKTH